MRQGVIKKRPRHKTTLFSRIMVRLTFPLFFLGACFTAVQLTNQINIMNEFHKIESRFAFEATQKALSVEMKKPESLTDLDALKSKLETMASFHRITEIEIFDLKNRNSIFTGKPLIWTPLDRQGIEESILQKRTGKSYQVRVDRRQQRLIAYIPLEGISGNLEYGARVIFSLASVRDALATSQWTLIIMISFIALAGIVIGQTLARSIVKPIKTLNEATQDIVEGRLGKHVEIHTGDEIETLASNFNQMSEALKVMKREAEDSNPLTQLPGNQGILTQLKKRILERQKFVLFHADLDRFKTFNDHYGLAQGDEAIKKTAGLLKKTVKEKGTEDDFVGHQGGDDFVIITRPNRAKEMAEYIIEYFDEEIVKSLYRKEDFERGYTLAPDRRSGAPPGQEAMVRFPLLAISLAGVSNTKKDFADYFDCMSAAAIVKKDVKKTIQSSYLIQE